MVPSGIRRRTVIAALALAAVVALTGCGPSSIASASYAGFPPGVASDMLNIPKAFSDGPILYLTLGGSSTCPPVPTSVVVVDGEMEITVEHNSAGACTADMAARTYEINLGSVPNEVTLIFDGMDRRKLSVTALG